MKSSTAFYRWTTVIVVMWALSVSIDAGTQSAISPEEVREALEFGRTGDPAPYILYHASESPSTAGVPIAALYTPYVRIAIASKVASAQGRVLEASDINAEMTARVAYMAFRWYMNGPTTGAGAHELNGWDGVQVRVVPDGLTSRQWSDQGISPLWVRAPGEVLPDFGAGPPFDDVVLVAAFPIAALQPNHRVVASREVRTSGGLGTGVSYVYSRISAENLKAWR